MIAFWYQQKFINSWFNTLSDQNFIEVTIIQMGWNPLDVEVVEYQGNLNAHNPRIINDADKSCQWILDEIVPAAIITNPNDIPDIQKSYFQSKAFRLLSRIISKQNKILEDNFLETSEAPGILDQYMSPTVVENKIVMNPMQTLTVQSEVFTKGTRLKLYSGEGQLPSKMNNLREVALFLLSTKVKWSNSFLAKLKEISNTIESK